MLSGAPCPGALWAAVDALRTLMGLRLVPNAIITLVFELPLPLAAAVHVAVIALTAADNDAYCAMPLLAHPLTQARMQRVAAAMHVSTTFATPLGTSIARPSAQYACTDVVQFCQVAFAVVPLVLLSWVEHVKGGAGGVARPAAELRAVQQHAGPPHQARLLLVLAKRAWHAAPRSVYLACGCGLSWPQRAALLAWLLSMLWLLTTF